jgi:hypothetical protein
MQLKNYSFIFVQSENRNLEATTRDYECKNLHG